MKLKKRQFARLKDISEEINTSGMFGLGGVKLDKLIADIESVQKVKTIKEKPLSKTAAFLEVCAKYQEEFYANHLKQGESMVAASTDETTIFKGGLRDAVNNNLRTENMAGSSYVAFHKKEKKLMFVYSLKFSNYPPRLTEVGLLKADHGDYCDVSIEDVDLYRRVDDTIKPEMDPETKIGDVGYFWDTIGHGVHYGILESIEKLSHFPYFPVNHKGNQFKNFSKTPPELK